MTEACVSSGRTKPASARAPTTAVTPSAKRSSSFTTARLAASLSASAPISSSSAFFTLRTEGVLDDLSPSPRHVELQEVDPHEHASPPPALDDDLRFRDRRGGHLLVERYEHGLDEPRSLVLIDDETGHRRELMQGATRAACLHPDGEHVLVATVERDLTLHRLDNMRVVQRFPRRPPSPSPSIPPAPTPLPPRASSACGRSPTDGP